MRLTAKLCVVSALYIAVGGISYARVQQAQSVIQLMQAVRQGNKALVATLVKQMPLDSTDEYARTAVHYAVEHKQVEYS